MRLLALLACFALGYVVAQYWLESRKHLVVTR